MASISMGNTDTGESANNLAVILRYGALPVSFERSSIQKVSASLGEDTLNLGLQAGLIGLIIISIIITRLYTRNVVPIVVSRIKNTRFLFPIKNKDITNV